jgi:hypothetical protein
MNFVIAGIMGLILVLGSTTVYAPEAGHPDCGDVHDMAYHIEENGRMVDNGGIQKGWMIGNEVYDNAWTLKYRMEGKRILDVSGI